SGTAPNRRARVHTLSARAASWLPGSITQGPVKPLVALNTRRIVRSETVCASNTSPATSTASHCCSLASCASFSIASNRASTKAAPSSVSKRLYERPICQSAVCKNVGISLSPGKPFDHRLANLILIQFFTINGDICVTSVQSKTLIKKLCQRLVRPAGYPSRAVIANPFDDTLQGNIKKHHGSACLEVPHGRFAVDSTTAGTNDLPLNIEGQQHLLLDMAQGLIAILIHDFLEGTAGFLLDQYIGINKTQPEPLGYEHSHGAFTAAGHTDKDKVLAMPVHESSRASAARQA